MMQWKLARRYASVLAGIALMVCVGSNHSISAWNAQLQSLLHYSQAEISLVCSMASFGAYFSVTSGFVFDHLGAHNSVLLGGFLLSSIYFGLYIGIVQFSASMHAVPVGVVFAVLGQATNFGVFAALGPNEGLFGEENRGTVMATILAAFSAGGALFALIYDRFFDENVPGFFQFMAVLLLVVFILAWFTLYRPTKDEKDHGIGLSHKHILDDFMPPERSDSYEANEAISLQPTPAQTDITGRELLHDTRFWLLFLTVFILVGSALFVMANIAFIVETLEGPIEQVPKMVALFSIGNCCGRLIAGVVSDCVLETFPRVYFISVASVLVAVIHTLFLVIAPAYLVVPITLSGIADGIMFAAFPVLTRETFGAKHFGKNFGMMSVANAIGFPLFFNPLGSFFYKLSASETVDGVKKCIGAQCFRPIFLLVICLSAVALLASLKFARRHHYNALI